MKYNKSEIMKKAWSLFKMSSKWVNSLSFSECLRRAWKSAKASIVTARSLEHEICKIISGSRLYMRRAVVACAGVMGWVVFGKTYAARQDLKRMGFRFDGEAKAWYTEDADVAENFLKF